MLALRARVAVLVWPQSVPAISVVFATHNRADRLKLLLASLRNQDVTVPFEVIVVDDGSSDRTPAVLEQAAAAGDLDLRHVRQDPAQGPAVARNTGWKLARAQRVAFTDDDCEASPQWLSELLATAAEHPDAIIQGSTAPNPSELDQLGPFSRTLNVESLGPFFQTCNVSYPRTLLDTSGGFDEETFTVPGGEDADLAWRCIEVGAGTVFNARAQMFHAVSQVGAVGRLKHAWRWTETVHIYARHQGLRDANLLHGVFWKRTHLLLAMAILGLVLPRRLRYFAPLLAYPYLAHLPYRARSENTPLALCGYYLVHDLVEMVAIARGAIRYRTPVL